LRRRGTIEHLVQHRASWVTLMLPLCRSPYRRA
jgi:hypothetical protein